MECLAKSPLDELYDTQNDKEDIKMCQNLLAESYNELGEKAAIEGCGSWRILDFDAQIQQLMRQREHSKALAMYDSHLSLETFNQGHQVGLLKAMQAASLDATLHQFQNSCVSNLQSWDADLADLQEEFCKKDHGDFGRKLKSVSLELEINCKTISNVYESMAKLKILHELAVFGQMADMESDKSADFRLNAMFLPGKLTIFKESVTINSEMSEINRFLTEINGFSNRN